MRAQTTSLLGLASIVFTLACGAAGGAAGSAAGTGGAGGISAGTTTGVTTGAGGATTGAGGATTGAGGATTGAGGGSTTTGAGGAGTTTGAGGGCAAGSADCNGNAADGCESDLQSDVNNCGVCGAVCLGVGDLPPSCNNGFCGIECVPGMGNCDNDVNNACETNLSTDPLHCGGCGKDCMGEPCVQGACACAAESKTANPVQLDLFIMLDKSGSMSAAVQGGGTRWSAVTNALKGFINDPLNAGLGVGIQYFGLPPAAFCPPLCFVDADCGAQGPCVLFQCAGCAFGGLDSCTIADYATAAVPIGPLGGAQSLALSNSINANSPSTDTPTAPALAGAILHAHDWIVAHPSHNAVVVFATDGQPTECNPQDIPSIANIAVAGVNGSPSVKSFVIGVGPEVANLNAIAVGGGTGSAYFVDTNADVVQQFKAALGAIQQSALGCEYTIPVPAMGMLDYDKVNVQYTPGNGGAVQVIANVANAAACDPNTGGWYYNNNAAPTKIILCAKTCMPVQADMMGKIDILLGCATLHR